MPPKMGGQRTNPSQSMSKQLKQGRLPKDFTSDVHTSKRSTFSVLRLSAAWPGSRTNLYLLNCSPIVHRLDQQSKSPRRLKQYLKIKPPSQFYSPTARKSWACYYNTFWAASRSHSVLPASLIRHGREWEACHTERTIYNQGERRRLCLL